MPSPDIQSRDSAANRPENLPGLRAQVKEPPDQTVTTTKSRALVSALIALAIVVVMFGLFYDISAREDRAATAGRSTNVAVHGGYPEPSREPAR
jgi:hypothetical protein